MRDEAEKRIGHLYPKATLADGTKATVIAWIWARTVTVPEPRVRNRDAACESWWLGKKKGKEAYVVPHRRRTRSTPPGSVWTSEIGHDKQQLRAATMERSVERGALCVACGAAVSLAYIREQGRAKRMSARDLWRSWPRGQRRAIYLAVTEQDDRGRRGCVAGRLGSRAHWATTRAT